MEKKFKFEVGNEVVIVKNEGESCLDRYIGRKAKIERVKDYGGNYPYLITIDSHSSWWSNTELELVEDELKVGDKVFIKSEKMKEHKEIHVQYKHLLGRVLTVKHIYNSNGKYTLEETEPFKKWVGIGIDGRYEDVVPMFDRDDLDKVKLETYASSMGCRISHDMPTHYSPHPMETDKDKLVKCILERYQIRIENYQNTIRKNEEKYNDLVLRHEQLKASLTNIREIADKELD